jgi:hypothetical protein
MQATRRLMGFERLAATSKLLRLISRPGTEIIVSNHLLARPADKAALSPFVNQPDA